MVKPSALLFLLAVAASQVGLLSAIIFNGTVDTVNISDCQITFYGRTYPYMEVRLNTDSSLELCFKTSMNEVTQDCIWLQDRGTTDRVEVNHQLVTTLASLGFLASDSTCFQKFELLEVDNVLMDIYLYNFDHQAVMQVTTYILHYTPNEVVVNTTAGDVTLDTWSLPTIDAVNGYYEDISGCRYSDATLLPDSSMVDPETCTDITCDESAILTEVGSCGPSEVCQGNNECTVVCTVTGSTVIDVFDTVHYVPDRCVYYLMTGSVDGYYFELAAGFRERRRKDVPFLDYLVIYTEDVEIYLEQGGRATADGVLLTLNTTVQLVDGVELSKDENGITAKIPYVDMTVFFDGNTAHVTGKTADVEGLCGKLMNPSETTSPSAQKETDYSNDGCDILHDETPDPTNDCISALNHCDLMGEAPFAACHDHHDPTPYINACKFTLCEYPDVDGLICHFFEAYAKTCDLMSDVTLGDWRSEAGCSVVLQDSCRDEYCSDHEFCGENLGETRCLCRALFARWFGAANPLGNATVCMENSATLILAGCLLWGQGIDYSTLHLNDESCTGVMDDQTHMVTFSFNSSNKCGAVITVSDTQVIYNNTIMTRNSSADDIINRNEDVEIDFSCFYTKSKNTTMSFRIKDSSVVEQIVSDVWNYTLTMNAYLDPNHQELLEPEYEIQMNQRIWLELKTEELDDDMVAVVIDSCWATDQQSSDDSMRYDLIINGCPNPADETVELQGNGLGLSSYFSFRMFEFFEENNEIYLHCKLELCPKQGQSCAPDCSGVNPVRKRRSSRHKNADRNPALITMVWNN